MTSSRLSPATRAAQLQHGLDPHTGALVPSWSPSVTFARDAAYRLPAGYLYGRDENPSFEPPERLLAELEGGAAALLFSSGLAAAAAVFQAGLRPGAHVVAGRVMYFGLRAWLAEFAARWGVEVTWVDASDPGAIAAAVRPGATEIVWVESPGNPTLDVVDLAEAARIAHGAGARLVVDSTVATPVHSQPIALGADLVMHSATKSLNGHSDVIAGALVTATRDPAWDAIAKLRHDQGPVLGGFEAWLLARGMRTLFLRVERSSASALEIARHFDGDARLVDVLYPGLERHPGHAIAKRQMRGGYGGLLALRVRGGARAALEVAGRLDIFIRATSLGSIESLVEHRASIEGSGSRTPDDLLRLSIGIEDPDDLIADLERALGGQDPGSNSSR